VTPLLATLDLDPGAWLAVPAFVLLGFALTVVTQSSSAAIAIALTASAGGSVPLILAAAAVIGTNIGTTSTAGLRGHRRDRAGQTRGGRAHHLQRGDGDHRAGAAALAGGASQAIAGWAAAMADITVTLAVFHTIFNCLGVLAIAGVARH
jgi:phosphate:Na+ symporter